MISQYPGQNWLSLKSAYLDMRRHIIIPFIQVPIVVAFWRKSVQCILHQAEHTESALQDELLTLQNKAKCQLFFSAISAT